MNKGVPLAEAKTTLSECIREVESGKSVLITRHGKPVAALVCPKDLDNLEGLREAGPDEWTIMACLHDTGGTSEP